MVMELGLVSYKAIHCTISPDLNINILMMTELLIWVDPLTEHFQEVAKLVLMVGKIP